MFWFPGTGDSPSESVPPESRQVSIIQINHLGSGGKARAPSATNFFKGGGRQFDIIIFKFKLKF